MSHIPALLDVASDFYRCVNASLDHDEFSNPNFITFWNHARKIFTPLQDSLDNSTRTVVNRCLKKAQDKTLHVEKRREDILMAANLIQGYALNLA